MAKLIRIDLQRPLPPDLILGISSEEVEGDPMDGNPRFDLVVSEGGHDNAVVLYAREQRPTIIIVDPSG